MRALKLVYVLFKIRLLSPVALLRLARAIRSCGVNLMALLRFAAGTYGEKTALADHRDTLTYRELSAQSEALMTALAEQYGLAAGKKVGLLCRNHASMVKALFAVSGTGADLYLLNADISGRQLAGLLERLKLNLLIHDEELKPLLAQTSYTSATLPSYHDVLPSIDDPAKFAGCREEKAHHAAARREERHVEARREERQVEACREELQVEAGSNDLEGLDESASNGLEGGNSETCRQADGGTPVGESPKRPRSSVGKLVLLTGGTTGQAKEAPHKPSLLHYMDPLAAFLARLKVARYNTAYIATPIYHGYGVAMLLLFCAIGKKVAIQPGFDAERACRLVREQQAEVVTVVPLMLHRMLRAGGDDLRSLRCIASGGAELNPRLAEETRRRLGDVLFNLYGTSEGGLCAIATPTDLGRAPSTIGRRISGSGLAVVNEHGRTAGVGEAGRLVVQIGPRKRRLAMGGTAGWIETGDRGYRDETGCYFLRGRSDSMIVSAGENVYPFEVEQLLLTHPKVEDAAVIGMEDEQFGQRLKAFVQLAHDSETLAMAMAMEAPQEEAAEAATDTEAELREWLRDRLARYQMPKEIVFVDRLPYTSLGKPDRKRLE